MRLSRSAAKSFIVVTSFASALRVPITNGGNLPLDSAGAAGSSASSVEVLFSPVFEDFLTSSVDGPSLFSSSAVSSFFSSVVASFFSSSVVASFFSSVVASFFYSTGASFFSSDEASVFFYSTAGTSLLSSAAGASVVSSSASEVNYSAKS